MASWFNEISVRVLARTTVDRQAVREWLDEMGADEFEIPEEDAVSHPALLVALAAKQCYMAFQHGVSAGIEPERKQGAQGHGRVS
ncbi:MAG: hypothetical protein AAB513_03065 [Patescibacteria group bacterium]